MTIDERDKNRRLESGNNLLNQLGINHSSIKSDTTLHLPLHNGGRNPGVANIPEEVKEIIGEMANDSSVREVAATMEVSTATVNNCKNRPAVLDRVHERALNRLMSSLNLLDDGKMSDCNAVELSTVAERMSRVVERTGLKQDSFATARLVVYAPKQKDEVSYKTIEGKLIE